MIVGEKRAEEADAPRERKSAELTTAMVRVPQHLRILRILFHRIRDFSDLRCVVPHLRTLPCIAIY